MNDSSIVEDEFYWLEEDRRRNRIVCFIKDSYVVQKNFLATENIKTEYLHSQNKEFMIVEKATSFKDF